MRRPLRPLRPLVLAASLTIAAVLAAPTSASAAWVWPVSGDVITPYRNGTDPYANGQHRGIDIGAPVGTAVVAAAGGEVRFAGTAGSSGLTISIRTGDGYDTSYLHLSAIAARAGTHVSAGDRIGAVGTTGTRSTPAPHLHFGVRDAGTRHDYHDPLAFLPPPPPPAPTSEPPPPAPATAPQPAPPTAAPVTAPRRAPTPHARPIAHPRPAPTPHALPRARPIAHPRGAPTPHALPHARPVAHPRPQPGASPRLLPRGVPAPHGLPAARGAPAATAPLAPRGTPHRVAPAGSPRRSAAAPGLVSSPLPASLDAPHGPAEPVRRASAQSTSPARDSAGGVDIGWIAACIGLLVAAGVLGLKDDRGTTTSGRVGRLLRPLLARR